MCAFDIFHFLPLVAIVLTLVFKSTRASWAPVTMVLSIVGLVGGLHVHGDHHHAVEILDPCYFYTAFLAASIVAFAKKAYAVRSSRA